MVVCSSLPSSSIPIVLRGGAFGGGGGGGAGVEEVVESMYAVG
jgi:hypothetical protein